MSTVKNVNGAEISLIDIKNIKFYSDQVDDNVTIGDFLTLLLARLWYEKESFSAKHPFGDSGWEYELYKPLIECGIIPGVIDEDGCIEEIDYIKADKIILDIIMLRD